MPYQIGTDCDLTPKKDAQLYQLSLQPNDYIIMGTDGLFDNLKTSAMLNSIKKGKCSGIAQDIANKAFVNSRKKNIVTPFAKLAKEHNVSWSGGKPDDITVLVAKVVNKQVKGTPKRK
eukprot:TRINITY_DN7883_c0_g1_i2.p1 TRINITY_DN7883_c0_g1~~TRINITY_DN7883_c0_g1_i2.p1  ORF type:complete len:118 (+),score=29.15 TRINITY_DN7883_c0_g1_i2:224-577(+)